jgi:hypothetical protein
MFNLNRAMRNRQTQWLLLAATILVMTIALLLARPVLHLWQKPHGTSLLYGKVSDTRHWYDTHGHNLITHAKVTINSLPPQTTYTDDSGQFWFKGLRNINYQIAIENPSENNRQYTFVTRVAGRTGRFYDLASDEKHNLKEMDY